MLSVGPLDFGGVDGFKALEDEAGGFRDALDAVGGEGGLNLKVGLNNRRHRFIKRLSSSGLLGGAANVYM